MGSLLNSRHQYPILAHLAEDKNILKANLAKTQKYDLYKNQYQLPSWMLNFSNAVVNL